MAIDWLLMQKRARDPVLARRDLSSTNAASERNYVIFWLGMHVLNIRYDAQNVIMLDPVERAGRSALKRLRMLFGMGRKSAKRAVESLRLAEAARRVVETARKERWPLLAVAEHARAADYWFAGNILDIVTVQGRRPDTQQGETLTRELRNGLVLTDDMTGLKTGHDDELRFIDLAVSGTEYERYVKWARTVQ